MIKHLEQGAYLFFFCLVLYVFKCETILSLVRRTLLEHLIKKINYKLLLSVCSYQYIGKK